MKYFFELFDVVDLENIKKVIESPIPYDGVFELLKKYEDDAFLTTNPNWNSKTAFYENHNGFQKRLQKEDLISYFYKDLRLLLKIKFKNIIDPNELITLDVLDSRNFCLILGNSDLTVKLTPKGEDLLFSNGLFVEKTLYQLSLDI